MPESGVDKVLGRIHEKVSSGAYYEAQQMYKTIYHRYAAKKLYDDSLRVLEEGAILQLRKGQVTCGVELGNMLLQALQSNSVQSIGPHHMKQVESVLSNLPLPPESSLASDSAEIAECSRLLTATIKWSNKVGNIEASKQFHEKAAEFVWKWHEWKRLTEVLLHYTKSRNWHAAGQALSFCGNLCLPGEEDMLLTRSILQVMSWSTEDEVKEFTNGARAILETYMTFRPGGPLNKPLINFLSLFLQALERKSKPLVDLLKSKYATSLDRDPNLKTWVSKVESRIFAEEQKGLMGGLLKMFLAPDAAQA